MTGGTYGHGLDASASYTRAWCVRRCPAVATTGYVKIRGSLLPEVRCRYTCGRATCAQHAGHWKDGDA